MYKLITLAVLISSKILASQWTRETIIYQNGGERERERDGWSERTTELHIAQSKASADHISNYPGPPAGERLLRLGAMYIVYIYTRYGALTVII